MKKTVRVSFRPDPDVVEILKRTKRVVKNQSAVINEAIRSGEKAISARIKQDASRLGDSADKKSE